MLMENTKFNGMLFTTSSVKPGSGVKLNSVIIGAGPDRANLTDTLAV